MRVPENREYVMFGGVFVLANKLQAVADKRVEGLSTKQWFLLRNLRDMPTDPPPTITLLARETDTSRQNVSKMLEVLQRQGYVEVRDSGADRRSQGVILTEEGGRMLRQVAQTAAPFFTQLFAGIDREDCAVAAEVVIKLIENLNQMQGDRT